MEVNVGAEASQQLGVSGLAGVRGKNLVGYARLPGGNRPIVGAEVGSEGSVGWGGLDGLGEEGRQGDEQEVLGIRAAYFERRRRMRLALGGVEGVVGGNEGRRRLAEEAFEEDERITALMIDKWMKVLEGPTVGEVLAVPDAASAAQEQQGGGEEAGGGRGAVRLLGVSRLAVGGQGTGAGDEGGAGGGGTGNRGQLEQGVDGGLTRKQLIDSLSAAVQGRGHRRERDTG